MFEAIHWNRFRQPHHVCLAYRRSHYVGSWACIGACACLRSLFGEGWKARLAKRISKTLQEKRGLSTRCGSGPIRSSPLLRGLPSKLVQMPLKRGLQIISRNSWRARTRNKVWRSRLWRICAIFSEEFLGGHQLDSFYAKPSRKINRSRMVTSELPVTCCCYERTVARADLIPEPAPLPPSTQLP